MLIVHVAFLKMLSVYIAHFEKHKVFTMDFLLTLTNCVIKSAQHERFAFLRGPNLNTLHFKSAQHEHFVFFKASQESFAFLKCTK